MKIWLLILPCLAFAQTSTVRDINVQHHEQTGLRIVQATVDLPDASWTWKAGEASGWRQVYVERGAQPMGVRGIRAETSRRQEELRRDRYASHPLIQAIQDYARKHGGVGPVTIDQLDLTTEQLERLRADRYFLVPEVRLHEDMFRHQQDQPEDLQLTDERLPLLIEVKPRINDGKHYICYNNWRVERQEADLELLARYGLVLDPVHKAPPVKATGETAFTITGQWTGASNASADLQLQNDAGETITCTLDLTAATPDAQLLEHWARQRLIRLTEVAAGQPTLLAEAWGAASAHAYGVPLDDRVGARQGNQTTMLNVMGGRAAVRETLQTQVIGDTSIIEGERLVPIGELTGVTIESHPYEQLLAGQTGGSLPLADVVPEDRLFVYFAEPAAMLGFLDKGNRFLFLASSTARGNSLEYGLRERYLQQFGIDAAWLRLFLKSDLVKEVGLVLPDVFFIDGTAMTIVSRLSGPEVAKPLLVMVGITDLPPGQIIVKGGPHGDVYWASVGDLLITGTDRKEVQRILDLNAAEGAGRLGQAAEFRYMLTKLPLKEETQAFAYLSDPFIRHLVGPHVKIAQLRRLAARAEMELITASALLYRLDGHGEQPTIEQLVALGYLPAKLATRDYRLDPQLVVHSPTYGTAATMTPLTALPVERVTVGEQKAYEEYVRRYSQFWRQFFDPIAVRLDDHGNQEMQLSLFILPLLDSSLYDSFRSTIATAEGPPLPVPAISPAPVLTFSLNLAEPSWQQITAFMMQGNRKLGLDPAIFDQLGPSMHIAVMDADPVITVGSGDLFGNVGGLRPGRSEFFAVPLALSVLTRPTQLLIELKDPDLVRSLLQNSTGTRVEADNRWDEIEAELVQVAGRDAWIGSFELFNLLRIRFGLQVQGQYLVISNLPWSQLDSAAETRQGMLNGMALQLNPGAGNQQLPGLFAAAMEQQRLAAFGGAGHLYPLLLSGSPDVAAAQTWHKALFGFKPVHPHTGQWVWAAPSLTSTRFGTASDPRQPPYPGNFRDFGMLRSLEDLAISLQLEDDGLRTQITWQLRTMTD